MKKRLLSVVLCLCMVVGVLPTTAMATSKTADNAIDWVKSQVGHSVGYDDGSGYYQCVEFIQAYYQWLGVDKPYGNGADYATNKLPDGWTRTAGGKPQKGDILVYSAYGTAQRYGHVAIYESDNALYDQNGNVYGATVTKQNANYKTYTYNYWGCIHPNFSNTPAQPTVNFSAWNNDRYTYIRETDAAIGQLINVYNGNCTETGMYLYDANGRQLATAKNDSYDVPQVYFKINEEAHYTLTQGTTYKYKFYAIVNGQTYWSNEGSFKTTPTTTPTPTPTPTPAPTPSASGNAEAEVNDTIERANRISVNSEITGSISKSSDVDWFVFQAPSDGYISLTFSHDFVNSSYTYWKTAFYTSDNKELNSWLWKGNATSAETGNQIGVPAGTYYLRISDNSFSSATYRFKVNYTPSSSWEKEFNETIVTANRIPTNAEISGSIRNSSDMDWFTFQVPSDGYISLTFSHDFVDSSYTYWKTAFYTSDNKELNSWLWKGNATSAETGNQIGVPAGTYYLRISDNSFSSATYRFKVNYTPSSSWEKEFNETIVTANRIHTGTEISGSIRNSSDMDWYQFELPENGMISLTFSHDFVDSSYTYWKTAFYTSDNKELNSWLWKGNATSAKTESKVGVSAGTYYLRISDNSFSSATYRFTVNFDSPNNPGNGDDQKPVAASGVMLSKTTLSLTPGSSAVLTAEVAPSNATDKTVVWRSENAAVATVVGGRVTAVGEGSTRIIASCGNVTASCMVSVKAEESPTRPGEVHFERVNTYFQDQFSDVPANQWYTNSVAEAFELGLMKGNSTTTFNPYGDVKISEAITMAARIYSAYAQDGETFQGTGGNWYQVYVDYAYKNGIISLAYYNCDVTQKASRAQFAEIFANSMPAEGLAAINNVADGAIPDISMGNRYAEYIYRLYRAGILTGSDANGTFNPTTYITRAEAAAIVSRMAESNNRVSITLR